MYCEATIAELLLAQIFHWYKAVETGVEIDPYSLVPSGENSTPYAKGAAFKINELLTTPVAALKSNKQKWNSTDRRATTWY